jgi:hypothetical protein
MLHNMVVYYAADTLCQKSVCFISDYLNHDAQSVHAFIQMLVPKIQDFSRLIWKFLFFSYDGAARYKKSLKFRQPSSLPRTLKANLQNGFLASDHGKNSAKGIGGAMKKLSRLEVTNDDPSQNKFWRHSTCSNGENPLFQPSNNFTSMLLTLKRGARN